MQPDQIPEENTTSTPQPSFDYPGDEKTEAVINAFPHSAFKMTCLQTIDRNREGRMKALREDDAVINFDIAEINSAVAHYHRQILQMAKKPLDSDEIIAGFETKKAKLIARRKQNATEFDGLNSDGSNPYSACMSALQANRDATFVDARVFVEVPKGATAKQMFEQTTSVDIIAAQLRKLAVVGTPRPIEDVKRDAARAIGWRAAKGAPDVTRSFKPRRDKNGRDVVDPIKFATTGNGKGGLVIDVEALFFWSARQQLTEQLFAEIDRTYDATGALTIEQRNAALAECDREIEHLDRVAEAYLDLAAEDGVTGLVRRKNVSPLAVVGLAIA